MRKNFDKRTIILKILTVSISLLLSFFILEFLFRIYLFGWDSFSLEKMNSIHSLEVSCLIRPSENQEILYELKPNLRTFFKLAPFETNSQGLRDNEYELSKPGNTFRVAVIGDSLTMPAGVSIEEAFHTLLEERLNKEERGFNYEFINFGVGGYSLRQYLGVINYKVKKYDVDLILVGFCPGNDHIVPTDEMFQQPYDANDKTRPFFNSFAVDSIKMSLKYFINHTPKNNRDSENGFYTEEQKRYMSDIFLKLGKFSKDNNIPIVVSYLWHRPDSLYSRGKNEVEYLATSSGLYFVDLSKSFIGKNPKDYRIYPTDKHPNAKANNIFAEELYGYLQSTGLLGKNRGELYRN